MTHSRNDGNTRDKDSARTPPALFQKLHSRFSFLMDAYADADNALLPVYGSISEPMTSYPYTRSDGRFCIGDSLSNPWLERSFGNCPYSNPEPFIIRAFEESLLGKLAVMLVPADTSTKVYHYYCKLANEIIFIEGRVRFNFPDGTPMPGAPKFGSMVVVFDGRIPFQGKPEMKFMRWKE